MTFDGAHCLKLFQATNNGEAKRTQDIGTYPNDRCVISTRLYVNTVGSHSSLQGIYLQFTGVDDSADTWTLRAKWSSDGLFIFDGSGWNEVGSGAVDLDTWIEWTFDCKNLGDVDTATVDIYKNGVLVEAGLDMSWKNAGGYVDGLMVLFTDTWFTANVDAYFDYVSIGTGCSDEGLTTTTTTTSTTTTTTTTSPP